MEGFKRFFKDLPWNLGLILLTAIGLLTLLNLLLPLLIEELRKLVEHWK